MENAHILKYILPTFAIVIISLLFDSYITKYLPIMNPFSTLKYQTFITSERTFQENGHMIRNSLIYFIKWYLIWILAWITYHFLLIKDFICTIKCHKTKISDSKNPENISEYEGLSISEDEEKKCQTEMMPSESTKTEILENEEKIEDNNNKKEEKHKNSLFHSIISPYTVTFISIFIIVFLTIALVETQISLISHESKNGSHHSKWMGAREYYTLDFFHNIPSEFIENHKLIDLFDKQDKAVASVYNWIANFRLFFGLFYLMLKSLGPIGIIICLIIMSMGNRINLSKDKNKGKKRTKFVLIFKYTTELSFFNIIFTLFLGFSLLSALFLEIKTKNDSELCYAEEKKSGFLLALEKRIETDIISEVMKINQSFNENSLTFNKHEILFVFENICEIFTPFYHKVIHLQEIFLFSMRVSEIFFGLSILLLLCSKWKENPRNDILS